VGAQAWLAQAQIELAALHRERGQGAAAEQLATEALTAARHLRLRGVEQQADRLLGTRISREPETDRSTRRRTLPGHAALTDPAASDVPAETDGESPGTSSYLDGPGHVHDDAPRITVLGTFSVQ